MSAATAGTLHLVIDGGDEALAMDVSARLASAFDQTPRIGDSDTDWSTPAGDGGGDPFVVHVTSLPTGRDGRERRARLLESAHSIVFVASATTDGASFAVDGLNALRADLGGRRCPLIVFGIQPVVDGGVAPEELRQLLGIAESDLLLTGAATDRARLRQVFAFAVRSALGGRSTQPATSAPAPATPAEPPAPVDPVGQDGMVIEATLNVDRVDASGGVSISADDWRALAEVVGELAVVRGTGQVRREELIRSLLGTGVLSVCPVASAETANVWGRPHDAAAEVAEASGAPEAAASPEGDRFRALKELRRQLMG